MANSTINALTALTGADVDSDSLAIFDASAGTTKKISPRNLLVSAKELGFTYVLAVSGAAVSVSASTSEEALATITVPANALGVNGALRISTSWSYTNGADDKTMRVRFSGVSGTIFQSNLATTTATNHAICVIQNANSTSSQKGGAGSGLTGGIGVSSGALATASVDTTSETTVVITGQKENSANTLTLERYLVEIIYSA